VINIVFKSKIQKLKCATCGHSIGYHNNNNNEYELYHDIEGSTIHCKSCLIKICGCEEPMLPAIPIIKKGKMNITKKTNKIEYQNFDVELKEITFVITNSSNDKVEINTTNLDNLIKALQKLRNRPYINNKKEKN